MLNEFSTNKSPTKSGSKNLKEIEKKDFKSNFSFFPSFFKFNVGQIINSIHGLLLK